MATISSFLPICNPQISIPHTVDRVTRSGLTKISTPPKLLGGCPPIEWWVVNTVTFCTGPPFTNKRVRPAIKSPSTQSKVGIGKGPHLLPWRSDFGGVVGTHQTCCFGARVIFLLFFNQKAGGDLIDGTVSFWRLHLAFFSGFLCSCCVEFGWCVKIGVFKLFKVFIRKLVIFSLGFLIDFYTNSSIKSWDVPVKCQIIDLSQHFSIEYFFPFMLNRFIAMGIS